MTLNITIVAPWGIWQCSDHRLTDPKTGRLVEDDSVKHVQFRFPDGGALLAYSGLGFVGNLHTSDWVRKILAGENRTLVSILIYLKEEATKEIGPIVSNRYYHMFSIGGFLQRRPWFMEIRNFGAKNPWEIGPPLGRFVTGAPEIKDKPMIFVSGVRDALTELDKQKLVSISRRRPKNPEDFHNLLAKYNRIASQHDAQFGARISPSCVTSFMPPEAEPICSKWHGDYEGNTRPLTIPLLLLGFDTTEFMKSITKQLWQTVEATRVKSKAELDKAGKTSVKPNDPIRRK